MALNCSEHALAALPAESRDVVVVSTHFDPADKLGAAPPRRYRLTGDSVGLVQESARALRFGGLLFVYGSPHDLAVWGEHLSFMEQMVFKYWIALDIDDAPRAISLRPSHQGLLMYVKFKAGTRFHLNTSDVRRPHSYCSACGLNVKDWGGKKHLMNPRGAALSDVWRDLPRRPIRSCVIPDDVLERVQALVGDCLHVVQQRPGIEPASAEVPPSFPTEARGRLETNRVYLGDCISFLKKVKLSYPDGVFDLAFADPPYNLKKTYDSYEDALGVQHYIEWCNAWLAGMAETLKPGGSLFVLNLPKWAMHHAVFLNRRLEFRHWIVWDALSDPRGKLMPAHYALLYYTKPGGNPVFNYSPAGSPRYCLRAKCLKQRFARDDDEKVELSDVWFDIHRIKHRRDRDAHPCQLPEKLMERIIRLTTKTGDLVFDPFCGAGTTAIAAAKLNRNFVVVDVDPEYVRITNERLRENAPRASVPKRKQPASKREVEVYLQTLARRLGRVPAESDIDLSVLRKIDLVYPNRGAALKRAKIVLPV